MAPNTLATSIYIYLFFIVRNYRLFIKNKIRKYKNVYGKDKKYEKAVLLNTSVTSIFSYSYLIP